MSPNNQSHISIFINDGIEKKPLSREARKTLSVIQANHGECSEKTEDYLVDIIFKAQTANLKELKRRLRKKELAPTYWEYRR